MFVDLRNKLTHAPLTLQMCTPKTPKHTHTYYTTHPKKNKTESLS